MLAFQIILERHFAILICKTTELLRTALMGNPFFEFSYI